MNQVYIFTTMRKELTQKEYFLNLIKSLVLVSPGNPVKAEIYSVSEFRIPDYETEYEPDTERQTVRLRATTPHRRNLAKDIIVKGIDPEQGDESVDDVYRRAQNVMLLSFENLADSNKTYSKGMIITGTVFTRETANGRTYDGVKGIVAPQAVSDTKNLEAFFSGEESEEFEGQTAETGAEAKTKQNANISEIATRLLEGNSVVSGDEIRTLGKEDLLHILKVNELKPAGSTLPKLRNQVIAEFL